MKIFIWILWLVSVGILHLFGNRFGTAVVLCASVITPVISWVTVIITSRRVSIQLESPEHCIKGQEASGHIRVCGQFFFDKVSCVIVFENLFTGEKWRQPVNFYAGGHNIYPFTLKTGRCGVLRISINEIRICELFGLFSMRKKCTAEKNILIPPLTFNMSIRLHKGINAVTDSGEYSVTSPTLEPGEINAIREYVPGDPIKNIHWKLSEKLDKLMVRELGQPVSNSVLILFETVIPTGYEMPDASELDATAEVFATVSLRLIKSGFSHTVAWKDIRTLKMYELQIEEDVKTVTEEYLSKTSEEGDTTIISCFLTLTEQEQRSFSHIIIVSPYIPPDVDMLHGINNSVTILYCMENGNESGYDNMVNTRFFSSDNYTNQINELEF